MGFTEEARLVECDLIVESWCDPDPPAACSDPTGSCVVDNDPDAYSCECADGSAPSGGGGEVCVEQLDTCPPVAPSGGVLCQDDTGSCMVASDFSQCECGDGQDFGLGGPGLYAGYTEAELLEVCEEELALCGAPGAETGISDSDDGTSDTEAGQTSNGGGCRIGEPALPVPAALGLLLFGLGIRRPRN